MLLELFFICHLTVAFANPYHKYPYVFLLDVGNEELQTTAEQIRVSIPGGSLALRYPAVGEGDSIAHVRVSGIDFGTDLKASIVDGGPGYKYVVIVFMGNPEAAYDAVITVSTLNSDSGNEETNSEETEGDNGSNQADDDKESDPNDSAENEAKDSKSDDPVPSASNFYDSAENVDVNGKEDISDEEIRVQNDENSFKSYKNTLEEQGYSDADAQQIDGTEGEQNNNENENSNQDHEADEEVRKVYNKYNDIRRYDDVKVHPQAMNDADNEVDTDYYEKEYSPEYPGELDQMFNDEEVHNDRNKYVNTNNNYNDEDDSSAVAY